MNHRPPGGLSPLARQPYPPGHDVRADNGSRPEAGNYAGAYGRLCDRAHDTMPQEDFVRIQSAQLKISSYEITGVNVSNHNGRVTGTVQVETVQAVTGARFTQGVALVKENGDWRVCQ
ncbi:hypothetical protein AB0877_16580 [Micromonospora sp. NPDC047644]|uniref:hypothetical protein n=1 Tax=Micromonospora sp. NPDC047644 TaxID=3157203 RepID=UPI003453A9E3